MTQQEYKHIIKVEATGSVPGVTMFETAENSNFSNAAADIVDYASEHRSERVIIKHVPQFKPVPQFASRGSETLKFVEVTGDDTVEGLTEKMASVRPWHETTPYTVENLNKYLTAQVEQRAGGVKK